MMILKKNKKGITLPFHWIFILVAGGLILAFFFSIAAKQKALSDDKLALSLVQSVDVVFEMSESSEGTSQFIPLPKKGISFVCSKGCDCYIQTGSARKSFGSNIIFSEKNIDSAQAVVWSLPWTVPFRAANLLYVTDPETRKIVVYNAEDKMSVDILRKLQDILPDNIIFEFYTLAQFNAVSFDGSDFTKIFFISSLQPFIPQSLQGKNVDVVGINPVNINFYDVSDGVVVSKGVMSYPGDISWVLAAIFSADYDMFVCGIKSALRRLNNVADVFFHRSEALAEESERLGLVCFYPSDSIKQLIVEDINALDDVALFNKIISINRISGDLKNNNDNLIQSSCPELF